MVSDSDFYKKLLDNLYDGVYFVDPERRITYWNRGAERITGYEETTVMGKNCSDNLLMHVDADGVNLCATSCPLTMTMADGEAREMCVYVHHKDGHRLPVLVRATPIRNPEGEIVGAVEVFSDNTALTTAQSQVDELQKIASLDALTQVGNRRHTEERLERQYQEMCVSGAAWGLLFIDIDKFKTVNDQYGHDVGDAILKMVAGTLQSNVRSIDFVGRWGGEEFLVILTNIDRLRLRRVAEKLRALVASASYQTAENKTVRVTVSIGAAMASVDAGLDAIVKKADQLLYDCKASGRNCVKLE
jgi:diguanylate cyclase (GGDEF)-like protein/PAS domain S-box-containing protein